MDLLVGGAPVCLVLVLAFTTGGTRSLEGPGEADRLALVLGDLDVVASDKGSDGGMAAVLVAAQERLIGLRVDTCGHAGQVARSLFLLLAGDLFPLVALERAVPAGR